MIAKDDVLVVGYGVVGKATSGALDLEHHIDIPTNQMMVDAVKKYNVFVICVPTPTMESGDQDLSAIEIWLKAMAENRSDLDNLNVIIRSTILPGTSKRLSEKYGIKISHVPEFLTESTAEEDAKIPELLVLGHDGDDSFEDDLKVLFNWSRANHVICCDQTTAELIKYSMNAFFSTKVIFANQIYDAAEEFGADYGKVKEALTKHKWGSVNGWEVWHGGYRGFGGKCLPKDLKAFNKRFYAVLLKAVEHLNDYLVEESK